MSLDPSLDNPLLPITPALSGPEVDDLTRMMTNLGIDYPDDAPTLTWKNGLKTVLPFIKAEDGSNLVR
jgi:hypothetical protein